MEKKKNNTIKDGASLSPKVKANFDVGLPIGKVDPHADAKAVARHYKHAAGKSNTYAPPVVDMIYHMARSGHFEDDEVCQFVAAKLEAERDKRAQVPPPTLDQLVFLSANLTRLVIDPYREKCNSQVQIGSTRPQPLVLPWPIVLGGVDMARLPRDVLVCIAQATVSTGLALFVESDWPVDRHAVRSIVQVSPDQDTSDLSAAAAIEISASGASELTAANVGPLLQRIRRQSDEQIPVGLTAPAIDAARVVDQTIDLGFDFYVADAQWTEDARPGEVFPELSASPAIGVLTDTMERIRYHCREETVQIVYRGGIRNGADAGKALCLGATAVTLGLSGVIGLGTRITKVTEEQNLIDQLTDGFNAETAASHLYNFAKSVNIEVTMLARACGKSRVDNMEPEDLRALTVAVSAATGIPVAGKDYVFRS